MRIRKIIGKLHLILGLSSGVIIVFLGITGCILAFQREIESVSKPYQFIVADANAVAKPPSVLQKIAEASLPGKLAHSITYSKRHRAVQVIFYGDDYFFIVYVDPYTGKVQQVTDMSTDFFRVMIMGHYYLWLPPAIGQPIVASATLIFVVMMITGLVLWWPRNKAARKQRFSIKWNAGFKRKNYDLHNVLGFYMLTVGMVIALTGMVMGFQWFARSVYYTASGGKKLNQYEETFSKKLQKDTAHSIQPAVDIVWQKMIAAHPDAQNFEVHFPENDSVSIGGVANPDADTYWKSDYRYFDQYSLKEIEVKHLYGRYKNTTAADKIMRINYDLHTGAALGLPGKILMFFASVIAASLPITGFILWRGRRRNCKK
ncbi:PepSY domain-containing protein [Ferruginibacter lapsinanis]|uniref:PepSY-associated TM helix domain-containing protein n=1 Tax=Ferruginibacter lapsinanis TaxID=563172 RepID=UPI001E595A24|nr:PepSY-associated TM helix domain-containing protein [Ferruginibacter lapsinanis]UEG50354.1 PepSY domain-containing protein [Ferruginibacter lapsinanis]